MRSNNDPKGLTFIEAARRAQIVDAAVALIAELGYPQVSIAKIAERINVAKSVVLYHFKTKDALIAAIVEDVMTTAAVTMAPLLTAESTAAGKLSAYIRANVAVLHEHRLRSVAMFEIVGAYRSADGRRFDQVAAESVQAEPPEGELALLDPLAIFDAGVRSGEFRPLPSVFMRNALRAALDGAVSELARDLDYDVLGYGEELVTIFHLATRRTT
jgi:TetR/AcrR family transcriptional regulator, fatty acid metabolism regulator protein